MTRPERTSRAGPLAVTKFVEFIFPLPASTHPPGRAPVHEPPREQTTSEFVAWWTALVCLVPPFFPPSFFPFFPFFSSLSLLFVSSIVDRSVCEFHRFFNLWDFLRILFRRNSFFSSSSSFSWERRSTAIDRKNLFRGNFSLWGPLRNFFF